MFDFINKLISRPKAEHPDMWQEAFNKRLYELWDIAAEEDIRIHHPSLIKMVDFAMKHVRRKPYVFIEGDGCFELMWQFRGERFFLYFGDGIMARRSYKGGYASIYGTYEEIIAELSNPNLISWPQEAGFLDFSPDLISD